MMLTPVVASKARMLRPSRPMIRPFMSSLGRVNTATVDSAVCSDATRWIAIVTILRARSSPSSRACCSISRTCAMAERFGLIDDLADQGLTRFARRHARDALQLRAVLLGRGLEPLPDHGELLVALVELQLADVELLRPPPDVVLRVLDTPFEPTDLVAARLHVVLGVASDLGGVLLRLVDRTCGGSGQPPAPPGRSAGRLRRACAAPAAPPNRRWTRPWRRGRRTRRGCRPRGRRDRR